MQQVYEHYTTAGWSIGAITRWLNEQRVATRKPGARWELVLDALDRELERRGHRFVRYASRSADGSKAPGLKSQASGAAGSTR